MKKKLIDLHFEWMKTSELPNHNGLCNELKEPVYKSTLDLFEPDTSEYNKIGGNAYWGSEIRFPERGHDRVYGPTRQSIVLLICAMHNEL